LLLRLLMLLLLLLLLLRMCNIAGVRGGGEVGPRLRCTTFATLQAVRVVLVT